MTQRGTTASAFLEADLKPAPTSFSIEVPGYGRAEPNRASAEPLRARRKHLPGGEKLLPSSRGLPKLVVRDEGLANP